MHEATAKWLVASLIYHPASATTFSPTGDSGCNSAWRETSSECSVMYFGVMLFDHLGRWCCAATPPPDRNVSQQHPHDRRMPERIHRRVRIGANGGDDLLDLAMIACARIVGPRAAVALQQQRRMVGTALGRRSQPGRQLHGDRHRIALRSFSRLRFLSPPLADFGIISFGRTG